ncbi:MAG: hypothetical protein AAF500_01075 [Myxococcota bacterium]
MFRCELCNRVSQPGERQIKVVVERRPAEYPSRSKAQRSNASGRGKFRDDPGGAGYEIVREKIGCASCIDDHIDKEPDETL